MFLAQQADWGVMADRAPDLDDARMQQWADLVERRTGIVIPAERRAFLGAGLRGRMQQLGIVDHDSYYRLLAKERGVAEEWSQLVDRLTVHETSFFRHTPSLQLLTDEILPTFVARNNGNATGFQVWSLGCSTGEEPYTLAMSIQRYLDRVDSDALFGITATDISRPTLKSAREGIYSERRMGGVAADFRARFCVDKGDGRWQITESLRRRICFAQLNILEARGFPLSNLDLISCQNMMIYYPRYQRLQILELLAQRLAPGGVMVLGPADLPCWAHSEFERIRFEGTLAFRRQMAGTASVKGT
ncbi:MAG: protein-glutamate O-methyltransferase CheR [Gammaproteobacteria bacterium]|nr:protein-glutamate O-methyltransferase CheR [Gammaproteobacteria bacterium]